ncbi:MAG: hypothetical protein P4L46_15890 [Fimbriimonas sp.]|nr:hypothetical protein [Fimbriimonas sp.]
MRLGGDLVERGMRDLENRVASDEALLVLIASPRLKQLGIPVPDRQPLAMPWEHALYDRIESRMPKRAHVAYNAYLARIVSFANAYRSQDSLDD